MEVLTDNDVSAFTGAHRPSYERLTHLIARGECDCVYVYSTDRLVRRTRQMLDYLDLCRPRGVETHAVTGEGINPTSANGVLITTVLGAVAEQESAHKAERIKAAYEHRARSGAPKTGGRRMFGYETNGVTLRVGEAQALREAADMILKEKRSLRFVTKHLREQGFTSTRGAELTPGGVRDILLNPRIAAISTWMPTDPTSRKRLTANRQIVAEGQWPAILNRDNWEALKAVLTDPSRRVNHVGNTPRHLVSGLLDCMCGAPMYHRTRRRKDGSQRGFYSCKKTSPGDHVSIGDEVEVFIAEVVLARLERDDMAEVIARAYAAQSTGTDDIGEIVSQREVLLVRREALEEKVVTGELDPHTFSRVVSKINIQIEGVDTRLATLRQRDDTALLQIPHGEYVRDWWREADLGSRRRAIETLMAIAIGPGTPGAKRFEPRRVSVTWTV